MSSLVRLSLSQDDASYLVLIPLISAVILYLERDKIFSQVSMDLVLGAPYLLLSGLMALASHFAKSFPSLGLQLPGWILALVLLWTSGFAFSFGKEALKAAHFPFLFLLLMVPILGVPALREGLVFHLAKVSIEVAKECSGIRSSMALLILALLVAHFQLRSFWNKVLFVACGLFMMILKNGVRIATLTLLAVYVNPDFLFGRLHHQGGVVFFMLALLLLLPLLFLLQRSEAKRRVMAEPS